MTDDRHPVDYEIWADYWDLLEHHGMNRDVVPLLVPYLRSPVLVLGSGQGLIAESLLQAGLEVVGVDNSEAMARMAWVRRGLRTVLGDARSLDLGRRFPSIVVSTGVVNGLTLADDILPDLLTSVADHLLPGGRVLLAYFRRSAWTQVAEALGLYGRPSANVLFWAANGDIGEAERLFATRAAEPHIVHDTFARHKRPLERQAAFIRGVGERRTALVGGSPADFLSRHSGFFPFPLTPEAEADVAAALRAAGLTDVATLLVNGGDTNVLVHSAAP